jgi:VanZ family protein
MTQATRTRQAIKWRAAVLMLPAAAWAGAIFYFSDQSNPSGPVIGGGDKNLLLSAEILHIAEFAILAALLWGGVRLGLHLRIKSSISTRRELRIIAATAAFGLLYGISDELHQSTVEGRIASASDVLLDVVGIMLTLTVVIALIALLKRRKVE